MTIQKTLKNAARRAINTPAFAHFLTLLERQQREQTHLLRVLTYHRVDNPAHTAGVYRRIMVSPRDFEQQMRYVAAAYNVIGMAELLRFYMGGQALPPRALLITFDDAYVDFDDNAWPILRRLGLPATLFVPTAFPDQPGRVFWWDRLYHALTLAGGDQEVQSPLGRLPLRTLAQREQAFSQLRDHIKTLPHVEAMAWVEQMCQALGTPPLPAAVLGWQALRRLAREGVTLGAHTRNHPLMTRVAPDVMRQEALDSLHDLEREIGAALPVFAYPSGGANAEVVEVLRQAGFQLAFLTGQGINDLNKADRLQLRRINVGYNTSLPVLRLQLHPWAST
jgi:peptidoglycan/xylan/chitin deacetylase (PgdA/CDA1 family)